MDAVGEQNQQAGGEFNRSSRDDGTAQARSPSTRHVACVIPATNDVVRLGAGQCVEHPPEGDLAQWPFTVQMALQRVAVDTCSSSEIGSFALRKANKVAHLRPLARGPVEPLDDATQLMVQGLELIEGDVRVVGSDPCGLLEAGQVEPPTVHVHETDSLAPPFLIGECEDIDGGAIPVRGVCERVFRQAVANDRLASHRNDSTSTSPHRVWTRGLWSLGGNHAYRQAGKCGARPEVRVGSREEDESSHEQVQRRVGIRRSRGSRRCSCMNSISEVIAIFERLDESRQRQLLEIAQTLLEDQRAEQRATKCG